MFLLPLALVFILAVLDVAWAGPRIGTVASPTVPHILHERIRRQVSQSTITNGTSASTNGSTIVPISLSKDQQTYYTLLSVGNISFRVSIDTASSDLWLFSSDCTSGACKSSPKYPLSYDSHSFVSVNGNSTTFNVSYADTSMASGFIAREKVDLGYLSIANQAFGLMNSSNVSFVDQVSGIMGLGFPRLSTINAKASNATPFFVQLAQQGQLDYPVFGVSLTRNASAGSLAVGAVDSSVVQNASSISWNEVVPFRPFKAESNSSSYLQWAIHLANISVGTNVITPQPTYPIPDSNLSIALLDVGTAGIFGPYQDVSRIFSVMSSSRLIDASSGTWAVPCDTNETMTFTFGDQNFTLLPLDYLIGPVSTDPNICLSWPQALPPSSDGIDWQFGSAFLRTVYTIFSYGITAKEAPMIGLYPLNPTNTTPTATSEASLSALFSSLSLTVATALPNSLISAPMYTTPTYLFNTSVPTSAPVTGLATSTYAPLFFTINGGAVGAEKFNISALPQVSPSPTRATLILTDSSGVVHTSTSFAPTQSPQLGVPYGWDSGAQALRANLGTSMLLAGTLLCLLQLSGLGLGLGLV